MSNLDGITINGIPATENLDRLVNPDRCMDIQNVIHAEISNRNLKHRRRKIKQYKQTGKNGDVMTISTKDYLIEKYETEINVNRVKGLKLISSDKLDFSEKAIISLICSDQNLSSVEIEKGFKIRNIDINRNYIYTIMGKLSSKFPLVKQFLKQSFEKRPTEHKTVKSYDKKTKVYSLPSEFSLIFAEDMKHFKQFIRGHNWCECFSNNEHVQLLQEMSPDEEIVIDEIPKIPSVETPVAEEPPVEVKVPKEIPIEPEPIKTEGEKTDINFNFNFNIQFNLPQGLIELIKSFGK